MFESLRRSLDDLLARATRPEDRRNVVMRMKGTLVQARMGLDDLRDALARTRRGLDAEVRELETVRRRLGLARDINDAETIAVAERFEKQHTERIAVLQEKVAVQQRELDLAEREVEEMKAEIRAAMAGAPLAGGPPGAAPLEDPLVDPEEARARDELDQLVRERARADRDADAARRLEELKRRMGK